MKQFIVLSCSFLLIGLLVGSFALSDDLQPSKNFEVKGEVVHAYFKSSNTSIDSGIAYPVILSYVFIANITNLSETPLQINQVRIFDIDNIVRYRSDFAGSEDYTFYPHASRLVAFYQVSGLYGLNLEKFQQSQTLSLTWTATFFPTEGKGTGGILARIDMPLKSISTDEFVYGNGLNDDSYFIFGQQPINAWSQPVPMK